MMNNHPIAKNILSKAVLPFVVTLLLVSGYSYSKCYMKGCKPAKQHIEGRCAKEQSHRIDIKRV